MIEDENEITRTQFSTNPTISDARDVIDDIADNFPYEKRLWDFSNIKFNFTIDEIKSIAKYGKSKSIQPNKLAIVSPDNWAYIELIYFRRIDVKKVSQKPGCSGICRKQWTG